MGSRKVLYIALQKSADNDSVIIPYLRFYKNRIFTTVSGIIKGQYPPTIPVKDITLSLKQPVNLTLISLQSELRV